MRITDANAPVMLKLAESFQNNPDGKKAVVEFLQFVQFESLVKVGGARTDIDRVAMLAEVDARVRCLKELIETVENVNRLAAEYEQKRKDKSLEQPDQS